MFEGIIYDPPIIEETAPAEATAETTVTTETPASVTSATTAPQTFDALTTITFGVLALSAAALKLFKKKK